MICEMLARDVVVVVIEADAVCREEHVGVGMARGRLETIGGELDQQAERILEVDRVHEAPVLDPAVVDPALVEPLDRLRERRLGDREREVMDTARIGRGALTVSPRSSSVKIVIRRPSPGSK